MTPAELAILRDRVARARLEHERRCGYHQTPRQAAGESALDALHRAERRKHPRRRPCVYCGARTRSAKQPITCAEHRDLPALDPFYVGEDIMDALKVLAA